MSTETQALSDAADAMIAIAQANAQLSEMNTRCVQEICRLQGRVNALERQIGGSGRPSSLKSGGPY